jgi:hypothetical protein
MRFSLRVNNDLTLAQYLALAEAAERWGFDQLWVHGRPDHLRGRDGGPELKPAPHSNRRPGFVPPRSARDESRWCRSNFLRRGLYSAPSPFQREGWGEGA